MRLLKTAILLTLLCGAILVGVAAAQDLPVRDVVTFQGVLRNIDATPIADGPHSVRFEFYNTETSTTLKWWEERTVTTANGLFTVKLGEVNPFVFVDFSKSQWIEMELLGEGGGPLPRIELTPASNAIMARSVPNASINSNKLADNAVTAAKLASSAAVKKLNGLTGNVVLAAGTNISITQADSTLTVSSLSGGGDDGDWLVDGTDLYRADGRVLVGVAPPGSGLTAPTLPPLRGEAGADKDPATAKMTVMADNEGFYSGMWVRDALSDGRAAIFGRRLGVVRNHGTGFGVAESNTAVTGYNDWGDSYTFGVAGYTWFDYNNTGGVLGARENGTTWASLAFRDDTGLNWGMYTPNNLHVGGLARLTALQVPNGAVAGHVLTSDSAGIATWQAPGAGGGDDGDWTIDGVDLYRDVEGVVAIGTNAPIGHVSNETHLQVASTSAPSLSLDSIGGIYDRWLFANYSAMGQLWIAHDSGSGVAAHTILRTSGEFGIGMSPSARLHVKGGNPDLNASNGDFWVGNTGAALRVGTSATAEDGSVNMRAMGTWGERMINLGVDDHTVVSVRGDALDFRGGESTVMARLWSGDGSLSQGAQFDLWGTGTTSTITLDGHDGGGSSLTMRDFYNQTDAKLVSGNSGGRLTLYNEAGTATVILDGQYDDGYGRLVTPVLEITGGADLSEQFGISSPVDWELEPGMVVSIDPHNPGELEVCREAYDRRVAGVISGAGGVRPGMLMGQSGSVADGEHPVALTGRVYVYADAVAGAIEPGDLLTTSATPGHAMKVVNHDQANGAVLGKAMTGLADGRGLILVLVSLQ